MVSHRPALGLRHRRTGSGPLLRRRLHRQADQVQVGLRASTAACLLHPRHQGRSPPPGRDHGLMGARGAPVQIWLRHRHQLLRGARRRREAVGRRPLLRVDELSQDRRPRGGRDQVGGHPPPRPPKMVIVHVDHPDIETYIDWKMLEEQKVAALVTGAKINQKHLRAIIKACVNCEGSGDDCFSPEKNPALKREIKLARKSFVPDNYIKRVIQFAKQGYKDIHFPTYDTDWDSEAYLTVSGQNSNNSVRVTDGFLKAVEADGKWDLTYRKNGRVAKTLDARALWEKIGYAAWASADPGLQYHTTVNDWHTCLASGEIRASNPCSEYMFLDDTACNLPSLNLLHFRHEKPGTYNVGLYAQSAP